MEKAELQRHLESLLFVADEPIGTSELARILEMDRAAVDESLEELGTSLDRRGIRLQWDADRAQLATAPEATPFVERLLGAGRDSKLTIPSLETLAVIAYRQPVTRADIEAIRGVQSDGPLRTLAAKGLICPTGRLETVGRPITYGTTFDFLRYFGMTGLDQLPPIDGGSSLDAGRLAAALGEPSPNG